MKSFYCSFTCTFLLVTSITQTVQAQSADTLASANLETVVVKAFESNRKLKDLPAAVNYINSRDIEKFGATSIVAAINSTPGIRMEERSPGSYRFNIRGSSLRSPFGVRNVKVYFNAIPFTDPGGTTYLNQLGVYNFQSVEIIKGPGSSLYGAGTGGVMLIEGMNANAQNQTTIDYTFGSYGLQQIHAGIKTGAANNAFNLSYQHQQSDGYRRHSALRRDIVSLQKNFAFNEKNKLSTTILYGDLFYKTPGGLTLGEFQKDDKMARPRVGTVPGAEQNKAAIYQKTLLAGATYSHRFSGNMSNTTTAYFTWSQLKNPAIRNYSITNEPSTGIRSVFTYRTTSNKVTLQAGGEFQQNFSTSKVYQNKNGNRDSIQTSDKIYTNQAFAFVQINYASHGWEVNASASINGIQLDFQRLFPNKTPGLNTRFTEIAPRVSLSKKIGTTLVYSSVARGFSPPTTAELVPSGSAINLGLKAETGTNYDLGLKGMLGNILSFDVNAFVFALSNTIVQRKDSAGGDFYINAGNTRQHGIETALQIPLFNTARFKRSHAYISHTWHAFSYKKFVQLQTDYSGRQLPGEAPHTVAAGVDFVTNKNLSATVNYFYSDAIPLNDANSAFANDYHLVSARIAWQKQYKQTTWKLAVGADNLLDRTYSLGNDINAFGGRYYNAAAGRNYYVTLSVNILRSKPM